MAYNTDDTAADERRRGTFAGGTHMLQPSRPPVILQPRDSPSQAAAGNPAHTRLRSCLMLRLRCRRTKPKTYMDMFDVSCYHLNLVTSSVL